MDSLYPPSPARELPRDHKADALKAYFQASFRPGNPDLVIPLRSYGVDLQPHNLLELSIRRVLNCSEDLHPSIWLNDEDTPPFQNFGGTIGLPEVLSWIAFGKPVRQPGWDAEFYFGATLWYLKSPAEIVQLLRSDSAVRAKVIYNRLIVFAKELGSHALINLLFTASFVQWLTRPETGDPVVEQFQSILAAINYTSDKLTLYLEKALIQRRRLFDAQDRLRRALSEGRLEALGRQPISATASKEECLPREPIPMATFRKGVTATAEGVLPWIASYDAPRRCRPLFTDLVFHTADVLRVWPEAHGVTASLRTETDSGQTLLGRGAPQLLSTQAEPKRPSIASIKKWFEGRVANWPKDEPPPIEFQCFADFAKETGKTPGRDTFRKARIEKTPAEWRQRGPRKFRG